MVGTLRDEHAGTTRSCHSCKSCSNSPHLPRLPSFLARQWQLLQLVAGVAGVAGFQGDHPPVHRAEWAMAELAELEATRRQKTEGRRRERPDLNCEADNLLDRFEQRSSLQRTARCAELNDSCSVRCAGSPSWARWDRQVGGQEA